MGMLEDDLDAGMRLTTERMKATGEKYEEARRNVIAGHSKMEGRRLVHYSSAHSLAPVKPACTECNGTGWTGHGQGGDTCGRCGGSKVEPEDETHISAWMPEPDVHIHQVIAKLGEELSEAAARCFRILESGYHEPDPDTKRPNWRELQDEIADVEACIRIGEERGLEALSMAAPNQRAGKKLEGFKRWHNLIDIELAKQGKVK